MKQLILILALISSLFSCTNDKKSNTVDTTKQVPLLMEAVKEQPTEVISTDDQVTEVVDTSVNGVEEPEQDITANDSINFNKYAVEVQEVIKKAPLDFSSYPDAKFFRTRIIDAYKSNEIDFGGHYIGTIFGCGASCIMGFIVDVRDGHIYDLPLGERNMCFWDIDKAISNPDSRLFISAICREDENSKIANYIAYVWNEKKKSFENVNKAEFIINK